MSNCPQSPHSNRTRTILHAAKNGKYAVGAYNWYPILPAVYFSTTPILSQY